MPESGRTRRWFRSGGPGTARMSWRPAIVRCSRSAGCRTIREVGARAVELADSLVPFLAGRRHDGTMQRGLGTPNGAVRGADRARCSSAGTARVRRRSGRCRRPRSIRPRRASSSRAATSTSSGRRLPAAFARWAGIARAAANGGLRVAGAVLIAVRTPVGEAWILSSDEAAFLAPARPSAAARLLPSGDTYFLLQGAAREFAGSRRSAAWRALDAARLAGRGARGRRDRRRLAQSRGGRQGRGLASASEGRPQRGRGWKPAVVPAARPEGPDPGVRPLPGHEARPSAGLMSRKRQLSSLTTWSMHVVRATTSSGSMAGNSAMRSWLRPSLR